MDLDQALAALGLEGRLARFYLAALELGTAPIHAVAARAGIGRTTAYDLAQRLAREELATLVQRNGHRHLAAADPAALVREAERRRAAAESALPALRELFNSAAATRPRIAFHEGEEGIRRVLWETLECRSGVLRGILSMRELLEAPGRQEMDRYLAERIRRRVTLRVLRSPEHETFAGIWPDSDAEYRELRWAPLGAAFASTAFVYDDRVAIISSRRENFGLAIQSEEVARLVQTLFELIWAGAADTPPG
ncbi:helix-turn-helix domain-containing protein [Roseomonas sp. NAR14]|uniref:Helix-turn-helix domain-containing protein n=1 Tax=Roseomonas acroporae TaxID=2937791 RepID=A0A9X1Y6T3_9PROT|nr:helix-turn-helix domain-containing protein [Roseomonas acroporae]MCK8784195.1 helix-turn-helix domain-containing protein [Roseomonas acroporae]